jgi:hypothetical protein
MKIKSSSEVIENAISALSQEDYNNLSKQAEEESRDILSSKNDEHFGIDGDNWNKHDFQVIGFIDWADRVSQLTHEINHEMRGTYAGFGDSMEEMVKNLKLLQADLEDIISEVQHKI